MVTFCERKPWQHCHNKVPPYLLSQVQVIRPYKMPALPVAPAGINLNMPQQPQNSPTLTDIANSIDHLVNVGAGFSMQYFLTIDTMSDISLITGQFTGTSDDVARAEKWSSLRRMQGRVLFFLFFFWTHRIYADCSQPLHHPGFKRALHPSKTQLTKNNSSGIVYYY